MTKLWAAIRVICFSPVMIFIRVFAKYASTNSFPKNISVVLCRSYRAGVRSSVYVSIISVSIQDLVL